jgi:Rifampin ADP-ribosyl transferase
MSYKIPEDQTSRAQAYPSVDDERYYHGTARDLRPGSRVRPAAQTGHPGNFQGYDSQEYAYAADNPHTAAIYADRALDAAYDRGRGQGRSRRVYEVAPLGDHEQDPKEENGVRSQAGFRVVRRLPASEWR